MWRSFLPEAGASQSAMLLTQSWEELEGVPQERGSEQFKASSKDLCSETLEIAVTGRTRMKPEDTGWSLV